MRDLMIDIETLGKTRDAVVVQVGAVLFDAPTGEVRSNHLWNLAFVDCQEGRSIDASTVQWWLQQSEEARRSVFDVTGPRCHPLTMVGELGALVAEVDRVWARGPSFDLEILHSLAGREFIPWWTWRDERVARDVLAEAGLQVAKSACGHNALADAVAQAHNVIAMYRSVTPRAE